MSLQLVMSSIVYKPYPEGQEEQVLISDDSRQFFAIISTQV